MTRVHTTKAGLVRMQERLAQAQAAYDQVVQSNPEANEAGDSSVWHDNFAYEENQRLMHQWARRVTELRGLLSAVELVEPPRAPDAVTVGTKVTIVDTTTDRRESWTIAGWDDGDAVQRRVAYNGPLGRALMGAQVGDVRDLRVGTGFREIEVVELAPVEDA